MSDFEKLYDCLEGKKTLIEGLLDGKGSVKLIDVSPRLCPVGYGPEYAAIRAARTSFGAGLKDPMSDEKLLRYLNYFYHTSPIEMVNATFFLKVPKFVAIHFLRHRTGKFNEFSQRYAEVPEEENFYNPLEFKEGLRTGSELNKQSSEHINDDDTKSKLLSTMTKANELTLEIRKLYHQMIDEGLAKEVARTYLPMGEYTTMYIQMDLNNLTKMLYLRAEGHTQLETRQYAQAMMDLVEPLFPICIGFLKEKMNGFSLLDSEISVLKGEKPIESITSISEKKALREKAESLGIKL
jgi:thymidylate synthase (FAD)